MFKFITIILISLLIINNVNSFSNLNLYSVTPGNNNDLNLFIVELLGGSILLNKSYSLPINNLSINGISNLNFTTGLITLFCSSNNQKQFLIDLDSKSGEFIIINSISNENNKYNNGKSYQNYLYGYNSQQKQQVYLASNVENKQGLSIVNWNFDQSSSNDQEVNIFSVLNTLDIDSTITPFGALDFNSNLIVAYHSITNAKNVATILFLDLNNTLDDSSNSNSGSDGVTNLLPYETHQIQIYLHDVSTINFLYTDFFNNVYIVSNGTSVCKIDFTQQTCYSFYDIKINYNNHPSFFLTQDKQNVATISSLSENTLEVGLWSFNFDGGMGAVINNSWVEKNQYSFFAI